jgi:hypothetical protein
MRLLFVSAIYIFPDEETVVPIGKLKLILPFIPHVLGSFQAPLSELDHAEFEENAVAKDLRLRFFPKCTLRMKNKRITAIIPSEEYKNVFLLKFRLFIQKYIKKNKP